MRITFGNEADSLLWTFAKFFVMFEERQYLFAAQGMCWLAALVQFALPVRYLINDRKFPPDECRVMNVQIPIQIAREQEISKIPRGIQR